MSETVAVLGTFQTPFKTRHPEHTFAEQAQIAAAGALHDAGMTPDATGGSAVQAAYNLVRAGLFRSVLIVGAERISETPDAQNVLNLIFDVFYERDMPLSTNTTVALWATGYLARYGFTQEDIARVVVRARRNALKNPNAHLKGNVTVEDVMASPMISYPLKLFDICPRSSGSAAMIVGNMQMAKRFRTRPAFT